MVAAQATAQTEFTSKYSEEFLDKAYDIVNVPDEKLEEFCDQLNELGIETVSQLEDAYCMSVEATWRHEREFAEKFIENAYNIFTDEMQAIYHAIDWQQVWDHSLSYDYAYIEFNGMAYYFNNNF